MVYKLYGLTPEEIKNYDLTAKNLNSKGDLEHKSPNELLKTIILQKEEKVAKIIGEIKNI